MAHPKAAHPGTSSRTPDTSWIPANWRDLSKVEQFDLFMQHAQPSGTDLTAYEAMIARAKALGGGDVNAAGRAFDLEVQAAYREQHPQDTYESLIAQGASDGFARAMGFTPR